MFNIFALRMNYFKQSAKIKACWVNMILKSFTLEEKNVILINSLIYMNINWLS